MRAPRSLLLTLAIAFAAGTTLYSLCWMYYVRQPAAALGITRTTDPGGLFMTITDVRPGGGAADAGLQKGDRIVGVEGVTDDVGHELTAKLFRSHPGQRLRLLVERDEWETPRELSVELRRPATGTAGPEGLPRWIASEIVSLYPLPFLVVGISVLLQRPEDRHAWLLAVVFAGFISAAPIWQFEARIDPRLAPFMFVWWSIFFGLLPASFYWFFSTFPAPSPLDRRVPWLKYALGGVGLALGLTASGIVLVAGYRSLERTVGSLMSGGFGEMSGAGILLLTYSICGQMLGLASLVMNAFGPPEIRRKVRVIVAGSLAGLSPVLILQTYAGMRGVPVETLGVGLWQASVIALFLVPLSFAYAVVKHRVLEIPVLIRRSARYLLVRRGLVTLTGLAVLGMTVVFAQAIGALFGESGSSAAPISLLAGAVFGIGLASAGGRLLGGATARIDRAFFRGAYDARRILQALAERSRTITGRTALAALLEGSLLEALQPAALRIFVRDASGNFVSAPGGSRGGDVRLEAHNLAALGLPEDGVHIVAADDQEAAAVLGGVMGMQPELVVVMQGRDTDVEGLILLGPRLSEEPYSSEDRELVASVAMQAGVTLENIRLAESMAERMEAERRATHELDIAREVQLKLLPQKTPVLATLECAGSCIQARAVGGDYYDFLDLGPGRVGLVLADISGKGISAALLMASLQANLRGQYAQTSADLERVLYSLNRTFYESTATSHYATLFFGIYDEDTRRLQYANCGHLPPVLRRRNGTLERLEGTAPVVGLFDEWSCTSREIVVAPGDSLVIFSDGVTDALNDLGEEFGEERLLGLIQEHPGDSAEALMQAIITRVASFASAIPFDDLTLMIGTGRR